MELEDYAGKTDRDLIIETHTIVKNMCTLVNTHQEEIEKLKGDNNKAKGALVVIGGGVSLLGAKLWGLTKLLGF